MDEFPSAWVRALLPLQLLAAIEVAPRHGYAIGKALEDAGWPTVKGATLYPALMKLETAGFVETRTEPSAEGPPRKVYSLTADGVGELSRLRVLWGSFLETVDPDCSRPSPPAA